MAAGVYNFTIEQGTTFRRTITWKDSLGNPIDLTGYSARMKMKVALADTTTVIALTTENDGLTLGGPLGTIDIHITALVTADITAAKGIYDLELVAPSGDVTRLLAGKIAVSFEVTN